MSATYVIKRKKLKGNINRFNKSLYEKLRAFWMAAGRAFVRAMADELQGHIVSGMTLGTLVPLAEKVGLHRSVTFPSHGTKHRDTYHLFYPPQEFHGRKSWRQGIRESKTHQNYRFLIGGKKHVRMVLFFERLTFQHIYNEPQFFNSLAKANAAFWEYIAANKETRFPTFDEWIDIGG